MYIYIYIYIYTCIYIYIYTYIYICFGPSAQSRPHASLLESVWGFKGLGSQDLS